MKTVTLGLSYDINPGTLPAFSPEEFELFVRERAREKAREREPNLKTAAEWAAEKGCNKDTVLRWLKRGIAKGKVELASVLRERADGRIVSLPAYRVHKGYLKTSPFKQQRNGRK